MIKDDRKKTNSCKELLEMKWNIFLGWQRKVFYRFIRAKNICSAFEENIRREIMKIFLAPIKNFLKCLCTSIWPFCDEFRCEELFYTMLVVISWHFICQRNSHQGSLIRTLKHCCSKIFGLRRVACDERSLEAVWVGQKIVQKSHF